MPTDSSTPAAGLTEVKITSICDVNITQSDASFIRDVAKHLMASAPLIEMDSNGNMVQVGEAKARMVANKCVEYAIYLNDSLKEHNV